MTAAAAVRPELARRPTPRERAMLCAALGLVPQDRALDAHAAAARSIDWAFLLVYARQHLALPMLARAALASPRFTAALDEAVRDALEHAALQNELQNRLLLADLARAVDGLRAEGIACVALKGAALLAQHPNLILRRHTEDIDLWVDPERAGDAFAALVARGYVKLEGIPSVLRYTGEPSPTPPLEGAYYQLPGLVSPRGTPLEIHRRPPTADAGASFHAALAAARMVEVDGVAVAVRDATSMLADLAGHVVVHHRAVPWLWPRHLVDTATLLANAPDLEARAARAAGLTDRLSVVITCAVLRQARTEYCQGVLPRRLVFPVAPLGWGVYRLFNLAAGNLRQGPAAMARALWPSDAFLRSRGFDPSRGALRAHVAHLRDVLGRAASR